MVNSDACGTRGSNANGSPIERIEQSYEVPPAAGRRQFGEWRMPGVTAMVTPGREAWGSRLPLIGAEAWHRHL